jgi:putative FmdB family regulatory protein
MYEYRCTQCGHRFEKIQNFSAEQETECPLCHGPLMRPLTAPRLHFGKESSATEKKSPSAGGESTPGTPASTPAAAPAATPSSTTSGSTTSGSSTTNQ